MLPAGKFLIGSPASEQGRAKQEAPQHDGNFRQAFALGKFEVTFEEYDGFAEKTARSKPDDSGWGRGRRPVLFVDHDVADAYCAWLGEKTGKAYRLMGKPAQRLERGVSKFRPLVDGKCRDRFSLRPGSALMPTVKGRRR